MRQKPFNPLILAGILSIFIWGTFFAIQMIRAFGAGKNMYWTARAIPLGIEETENRFEIFIDGALLQNRLEEHTLLVIRDGEPVPLGTADIAVRVNNWHQVKSGFLFHALWPGMILSACAALVVGGLIQSGIRTSRIRLDENF